MIRYKVNRENIEDVKSQMAANDQAAEIQPGDETWGIIYQPGNQRGQMTRYANGRGAICFGGPSRWGDWEEHDGQPVLMLDDAYDSSYDEAGKEWRYA